MFGIFGKSTPIDFQTSQIYLETLTALTIAFSAGDFLANLNCAPHAIVNRADLRRDYHVVLLVYALFSYHTDIKINK